MTSRVPGVRLYFNGKRNFYLRNGEAITPTEDFIKNFPVIPLDGILRSKSGKSFDEIITSIQKGEGWEDFVFCAVDLPNHHHYKLEERIELLRDTIASLSPNLEAVKYELCQNQNQLTSTRADSIILRKPKSFYNDQGSYFEWQAFEEDEALVFDSSEEVLKCKLYVTWIIAYANLTVRSNNTEITLKKPNVDVPIGSVVTFRSSSSTSETKFDRLRRDLKWNQLLLQRRTIPYYVSYGKANQPMPKCRGCKAPLPKHLLRVLTDVTFRPIGCGPYQGKASFCLSSSCVQIATSTQQKLGVQLPHFDGRVLYDPQLITKEASLPDVEGILWNSL